MRREPCGGLVPGLATLSSANGAEGRWAVAFDRPYTRR